MFQKHVRFIGSQLQPATPRVSRGLWSQRPAPNADRILPTRSALSSVVKSKSIQTHTQIIDIDINKYIYIHVGHDLGLPRYFVWHSSLNQAQALISHPAFGFPIAPVPTYSSMVSRDEPQPCPFKDRRSWRLKSCAGEQLAIKQPEPAIHKVHREKLRHLSARPSTSKSSASSASSSSSYFTKM